MPINQFTFLILQYDLAKYYVNKNKGSQMVKYSAETIVLILKLELRDLSLNFKKNPSLNI